MIITNLLLRSTGVQCYRKFILEARPTPFSRALVKKREVALTGGINQCTLGLGQQSHFSSSSAKKTSLSEKIKQDLSVFRNVDLSQLKCVPVPASLYGFGGIIPFVFPPLYFIMGSYSPFLATAQLMYGATILAFVGGVKWGNAVANDDISHEHIGMSTVPSLVAWGSLLVPEPVGFLTISSGLIGALYIDLVSSKYPPWFCALRFTLTSVATASLLTTFLFNVFH